MEQTELMMKLGDEVGEKSIKAEAISYSGYLNSRTGEPEKALEAIKEAIKVYIELEDLRNQRLAMCWEGVGYLDTGSMEQAQKLALELKNLIQEGPNRKAWRYFYLLNGLIEMKKGNSSKAIENFNQASSLLSCQYRSRDEQAIFFEPLAQAYYKAGDLKKAQEEYERIAALTTGRTAYGDIYAKSFYMLGKIAEQQGENARAGEQYRKFLDLWKDADPGLSVVEDAKKRLAAL
jgi:tetratricopeptide (TPR) repeat protein